MPHDNYPFGGQGGKGLDDAKKLYKEHKGLIKTIVLVAALIAVGMTSFYTVGTEEVGVVMRFGQFVRIEDPGANFKIPIIESVLKVPNKRQLKEEFGFRTRLAGVNTQFARDAETKKESTMLTGDLNVAVVEWIVHYQIEDPYQFVFKVRNVRATLRALSEATMSAVVGDHSVTEVLTRGREEILEKARLHLSKLCKQYETGIAIRGIELKDSAPPPPVVPSFNEVNQAEQERDRLQNEAWAQYNKEIFRARGEAKKVIESSRGYAVERVNRALGEVQRFLAIQKEYAAAPEVTRSRIYLESLSEILPQAGKKVFVDEKVKSMIPMLFPMAGQKDSLKGEGRLMGREVSNE